MISARAFAAQSSIWHRATPTLEQFTRWVNRNRRSFGHPVNMAVDPDRASRIAEVAFELVASQTDPLRDVEQEVSQYVQRLPGGAATANPFSDEERLEAAGLQNNLKLFLRAEQEQIVFRPQLRGCGIVEPTEADLLTAGHLVEVKSVQRGFRGLDFRQVLTYAAMARAGSIPVTRISLVNPRMAWSFSSSAEGLALDIGAGSWFELMQDLIDSMTDPGVSL